MKKYLLILWWLFIACNINAQVNFVLNPSFEHYSHCPTGWDQIRFANYWNDIDTTAIYPYGPWCSGEYCNTCAGHDGIIGVPYGGKYYHYARSGNGMAEMLTYFDNSFTEIYQRDYIQGKFSTNLIAGKSYCVTFYVTLAQASQYAINHIGAYIDDGSIDAGQDSVGCASPQTAFVPQIVEDSIINDTLNWVKVQGNYTANGTERFITIGNFFDIHHTDTIKRHLIFPWDTANPLAWYLVDDVSVIASDTHAFAGNDTIIAVGDSLYLGIDSNGEGMPCIWYTISDAGVVVIDSGGRIKVKPTTTTTYVVVMDLCGLVTRDTVVVAVWPVGVGNVSVLDKQKYLMQPNPNDGSFKILQTIADNLPVEIEILNTIGQSIYKQKTVFLGLESNVTLKNLPPGLYLLKLMDNKNRKFIFKFVIQ